jgi:excisionase family DNA binding protein
MRIWLNVAEAAEYAAVCRDTIYTAVERGELRHVRIASRRSIRLKAQWLDEWLEAGMRGTPRPAGTRGGESERAR